MKLSRREFLKGASASAVGGLLLSKAEALQHPGVALEDKAVLERDRGRNPHGLESWESHGMGPEYVLWDGRLYIVTSWERRIPYDPALKGVPHEELTLGAMLVREER